MYYYVFMIDGKVAGFLESETIVHYPNAKMVTAEEYKALGGVIAPVVEPSTEPTAEELIDILLGVNRNG